MSAINTMPTERNYGLGFNYSAWTAGTSVTLCNVKWNSDYRDIVRFENQGKLNEYLSNNSGPVINLTKISYAKFGRPIRLDVPFNAVQNYNYVRVVNAQQPVSGDMARTFYYFVTDVVYINPNCTEIYVQLDVWQTFGYTTSFGNCFIEQGHAAIAAENSFDDFGRENLTTPEGLDIGNEYQIVKQYKHTIAGARIMSMPGGQNPEPVFSILVASTVALDNKEFGTVDKPVLNTANGSMMENLPNGCELYNFPSLGSFKQFMEFLSDKPWISQGIVSIMAVPSLHRYKAKMKYASVGDGVISTMEDGVLENKKTNIAPNWRNEINLGRYSRLKKFLTFPYCVLEMTSYTGTPLLLKPECWGTSDMEIMEVPHFAPPNARLAMYPFRYNTSAGSPVETDEWGNIVNDGGEFLDTATGITNFPTFSIVNNAAIGYMASNANSIAYQHSSADWSQQKTQQGISTSYDQASAGIGLSNNLTNQGINASNAQANLSMETQAMSGMQGAINGAVSNIGSPAKMAGGIANAAIGTAIGMRQTNNSNNIGNALAAGQNKASTENMAFMRDTNKALSSFSANGDYQNAIAGINARVQDAKLIQPTTSGQMGGEAFNLAAYKWGVDIKVKMPQAAVMRAIGEYWLRYGYAINRFGRLPYDFHAMEKFTYWKLKETYIIKSSCPESMKQVLRGIFEKGVTVWRNPADIGLIDIADNAPLPGIRI